MIKIRCISERLKLKLLSHSKKTTRGVQVRLTVFTFIYEHETRKPIYSFRELYKVKL